MRFSFSLESSQEKPNIQSRSPTSCSTPTRRRSTQQAIFPRILIGGRRERLLPSRIRETDPAVALNELQPPIATPASINDPPQGIKRTDEATPTPFSPLSPAEKTLPDLTPPFIA
ncbi:unnamed protein product [Linum trigynum]|uniref:Uncharacterized protein n=1 Tax=Linum trigynum TaxID=586398 RepID=A0AAV2GWD7_9ROSI